MALIETKGIEKVFGGETPTVALRNINFIVDRGEFVSIVGPSGSGKSTLLQILGLFDPPTAGIFFLDGKILQRSLMKSWQSCAIAHLVLCFNHSTYWRG